MIQNVVKPTNRHELLDENTTFQKVTISFLRLFEVSEVEQTNQRIMITKKLLKDALLRLLENKPVAKITITELCRTAGINRSTFYAHYEIPHDVLLDIEHDLMDELTELLQPLSGRNLRASAEIMCHYLYEHADLLRILIRNFSDHDLEQMMNESYLRVIEHSNVKMKDKDLLRLMVAYMAGGGYSLLALWLQEDIKKTPEEIAELLADMFSEKLLIE